MNKGFTLVELLAVLFILSVITIVAVHSVITTNKKSKENDIEQFKKTVENAAEVYVETHLDLPQVQNLKDNGIELCIQIKKLINGTEENGSVGLLNANLKNPENGIEITSLNASVKATKQNNEIIYEYKNSNNCT